MRGAGGAGVALGSGGEGGAPGAAERALFGRRRVERACTSWGNAQGRLPVSAHPSCGFLTGCVLPFSLATGAQGDCLYQLSAFNLALLEMPRALLAAEQRPAGGAAAAGAEDLQELRRAADEVRRMPGRA